MPEAQVKLPDGRTVRLQVPEGATQRQIKAFAKRQLDAGAFKAPAEPAPSTGGVSLPDLDVPTLPEEPIPGLPMARARQPGEPAFQPETPGFIDRGIAAMRASENPLSQISRGLAQQAVRGAGGLAQLGTSLGLKGIQAVGGLPDVTEEQALAPVSGFTKELLATEALRSRPGAIGERLGQEAAPLLIPGGAAAAARGPVSAALRGGALGGLIGGGQFKEDPAEAGLAGRASEASLGFALGGGIPAGAALGGLGLRALSPGATAARRVAESAPESAIIEAAEAARRGETVLAPVVAGRARGTADVKKIRLADTARRDKLEDAIQRSELKGQGSVSGLFETLLPEGTPTRVQKLVGLTFERAKPQRIDPQLFSRLDEVADNPALQKTLQDIAKNPSLAREFNAFEPNQVGRLDILRTELSEQMEKALRNPDASVKPVKEALDAVNSVLREGSPRYRKALELSQREQIVRTIGKRVGLSKKLLDDVTKMPADQFYSRFMRNDVAFNRLRSELNGISNPARRESALAKSEEVREALRRIVESKKALQSVVEQADESFARRSGVIPSVFYTAVDALSGRHNAAFIDYILDEQITPGKLRGVINSRDPVEMGTQFGTALGLVLANPEVDTPASGEEAPIQELEQ